MKIYFTASISGKKELVNNYKAIVKSLEDLGNTVIASHILGVNAKDLEKESKEERVKHFNKVKKWIGSSEMMVAEVSHSSTNVGYEISLALEKEKPVLALYIENKAPVLLVGISYDRLALIPYKVNDLKNILKSNIEDLKEQMDVRFNFFISPEIGIYLDWISKHRRIPRAVFLRRLIEEHMQKNKEYKSE
jgi:hypothetical protein